MPTRAFYSDLAAAADARLMAEVADAALPDAARLGERTRVACRRALAGLVEAIEADLRRDAARRLAAPRGEAMAAGSPALDCLAATGVTAARWLLAALIPAVRLAQIAAALPAAASAPDRPSLVVRLVASSDRRVAAAAQALLAAENGPADRVVLPPAAHRRLVWSVAAALRDGADAEVDRALAAAAAGQRHDGGYAPTAAAVRLVAALDPPLADLPALLVEALGDRRLALFAALLARAAAVDAAVARGFVLDPAGDELWLALRAAGSQRADLARVALSLAEADPRRDIDAFADRLDSLVAVTPDAARATLAPWMLPRAFRVAIDALATRP